MLHSDIIFMFLSTIVKKEFFFDTRAVVAHRGRHRARGHERERPPRVGGVDAHLGGQNQTRVFDVVVEKGVVAAAREAASAFEKQRVRPRLRRGRAHSRTDALGDVAHDGPYSIAVGLELGERARAVFRPLAHAVARHARRERLRVGLCAGRLVQGLG